MPFSTPITRALISSSPPGRRIRVPVTTASTPSILPRLFMDRSSTAPEYWSFNSPITFSSRLRSTTSSFLSLIRLVKSRSDTTTPSSDSRLSV